MVALLPMSHDGHVDPGYVVSLSPKSASQTLKSLPSAGFGASAVTASGRRVCRRWCQLPSLPVQPPPLVAAVRCRVGNQGRLPWPSTAGGCAAPAAVRRSSSLPWNALRSSLPRPSRRCCAAAAVCATRAPFATLHRVCLGRLPPLAVQPPPPFKDIFKKYLDWEVLPLMLEKEKEPLLRDTLQRWSNHKKMAEDCLEKEKERVYQYLHSSSEEKLLGKVVLTLAENMQINFEEYLNLNPQKQSKQYLRSRGSKTSPDFHMLKCKLMDPDGIISALAFCPAHSGMLAAGSYKSDYAIYWEVNMELLYVLHCQEGGITHVQFSRDGNYLYTGNRKVGFVHPQGVVGGGAGDGAGPMVVFSGLDVMENQIGLSLG
ncbi:hypothetical protein Scep_021793 [Stephania cephalantha]|uniref:Uncharacterized protein n=1 Tax=Stephania cephalantha TaxID=152367 RepID=A0AAP0FEU0_9MAGN